MCSACHIVFIGSIPEDLGRYYAADYAPYQRPSTKELLKGQIDHVRFRMDLVKRFKKEGRLLEIGPSYGAFSLLAKENGFDVEVIEMDPACCDFIRNELDIPATQSGNVEEVLQNSKKTYDVIALWHNIEHVPQPWIMFQALSKHLNPGGIIIFSTPNPDALQFQVLRRFWVNLDAPRHLYLIPVSFVQNLLKGFSLQQILVTSDDDDSRELTKYGWSASLKKIAGKNRFAWFVASVAGRLLSWLFGGFEKGKRASAYTAVFQKPLPTV